VTSKLLLAGAAVLHLAVPASFAGESQAGVQVSIAGYRFSPAELKVSRGSTVTWTNQEKRTSHSVLFTGPGGFESERIFPGESWSRTFDAPGSYPYTCGPHPEMKGRIDVTD
jgi:plastocyanin